MKKLKLNLNKILAFGLILSCLMCLFACSNADNERIISSKEGITKIQITDKRTTTHAVEIVEDEQTISLIANTFYDIKGTEVRYVWKGSLNNKSYEPDFSAPLFEFEITQMEKGKTRTFLVYGGRKVPVYANGTGGRVVSLRDDYDYVAKRDQITGHYEKVYPGLNRAFFEQFFN